MALSEWKRRVEWALKSRLTASPRVRARVADPDAYANALADEPRRRWDELAARHPRLTANLRDCSADCIRESVYVLDILDRYVPEPPVRGRCLDIGSRNWAYLPGLRTYAPLPWDGVELDAHQRYFDLTTRRAHGEAMAARHADCRYLARSLLAVRGEYALITWLLPFVHPAALRRWGLPERYFQPRALLSHAWELLGAGGAMLIVNQGEEERDIQGGLLEQAGVPATPLGELVSVLSPFRKTRYGWWVVRAAAPESDSEAAARSAFTAESR